MLIERPVRPVSVVVVDVGAKDAFEVASVVDEDECVEAARQHGIDGQNARQLSDARRGAGRWSKPCSGQALNQGVTGRAPSRVCSIAASLTVGSAVVLDNAAPVGVMDETELGAAHPYQRSVRECHSPR